MNKMGNNEPKHSERMLKNRLNEAHRTKWREAQGAHLKTMNKTREVQVQMIINII